MIGVLGNDSALLRLYWAGHNMGEWETCGLKGILNKWFVREYPKSDLTVDIKQVISQMRWYWTYNLEYDIKHVIRQMILDKVKSFDILFHRSPASKIKLANLYGNKFSLLVLFDTCNKFSPRNIYNTAYL